MYIYLGIYEQILYNIYVYIELELKSQVNGLKIIIKYRYLT